MMNLLFVTASYVVTDASDTAEALYEQISGDFTKCADEFGNDPEHNHVWFTGISSPEACENKCEERTANTPLSPCFGYSHGMQGTNRKDQCLIWTKKVPNSQSTDEKWAGCWSAKSVIDLAIHPTAVSQGAMIKPKITFTIAHKLRESDEITITHTSSTDLFNVHHWARLRDSRGKRISFGTTYKYSNSKIKPFVLILKEEVEPFTTLTVEFVDALHYRNLRRSGRGRKFQFRC